MQQRITDPQEAEENQCYASVETAVTRVMHLEREWDSEKLQKKVMEYIRKAGKNSGGSTKSWQQVVTDFSTKFFEVFSTALGDRPWIDHVDFSACIASGVKAYGAPNLVTHVPPDEYMQTVIEACSVAHDMCRYYSHAWAPMKELIPNKVAQKKVREAVDEAREKVVKQKPGNVDVFITSWIQLSIDLLSKKSVNNNPKASLSEADANKLFGELVHSGSGVPLWLEKSYGGKLPPSCPEVINAVALAYANFPEPAPRLPPCGKGGGKLFGKGGFGGKGFGDASWGNGGFGDFGGKGCGDSGWFDTIAYMASAFGDAWSGKGDAWSGKGDAWSGKGDAWGGKGKGWSPY